MEETEVLPGSLGEPSTCRDVVPYEPSATSNLSLEIEEHINDANADSYDEDQAELRCLYSKPTCYLMFGKQGAGLTTLASRVSHELKCEHVNATNVIQQAIDMQTELGVKVQELLLRGEAVPEDMVITMIENKINSPEVAHHGYILEGFPTLSEGYLSTKDQLEMIKKWKLQPDFVINVKIPDPDLENRRLGQRVDSMTGDVYTKEVYHPEKPVKKEDEGTGEEEEEEEEEEMLPEEEEEAGELAPEVLERLVRRPEDLPSTVAENVETYRTNVLRILEDYMADHDHQKVIELDANKQVEILFKEILVRLDCFVLHPPSVPIRLHDNEEEEIPEDIDTDELMRNMATKNFVGPKYRWRRSRWGRYCPVALAEGNLTNGKPEFGVSFLDKMYFLSSGQAMSKFMKNPRAYVLPPQPRPPCKLCITGPPSAGKSTMAHLLAQKYNAKVLSIDELIKPKLEEERASQLELAKQDAMEQAIQTVKSRIRDRYEEDTKDETGTSGDDTTRGETEDDADTSTEKPSSDLDTSDQKTEEAKEQEDPEAPSEPVTQPTDESISDAIGSEKPDPGDSTLPPTEESKPTEALIDMVDENHPEVLEIVQEAVEAAKGQDVVLPPETYVEVMEEAIENAEKDLRKSTVDGPMNGSWILDNFPTTREQWSILLERNKIVPDDIICLRDESDNGDFLIKRWYFTQRDEIEDKIQARKAKEEQERLRKEEEFRRQEEEARIAQELQEKAEKEEERRRRIEAGEEVSDDEEQTEDATAEPEADAAGEQTAEQQGEQTEEQTEEQEEGQTEEQAGEDNGSVISESPNDVSSTQGDDTKTEEDLESEPPSTPDQEKMPPEGPELNAQREARKVFDTEWPASIAVITGSLPIEPFGVEICSQNDDSEKYEPRREEDIITEIVTHMEKTLKYNGWELTGQDIDEEEEDLAAAAEEEEEEEEEEEAAEEEEDPNRSLKKALGDTSYFCPVTLCEKHVLWPGNPEVASKYREKLYYLSSNEARDKFLANPSKYLPTDKPFKAPPIRLLILGSRGSGKSLHGRQLANNLGLFHIQFRERLQELIIAKTKKKVGPEYEQEQKEDEEPEEEESEDEEEAAITGPDGVPVNPTEAAPTLENKENTAITEAEETKEEEAEPELTEDEESIKAYLETDEPLPNDLMLKIVSEWWHKEPFKSTGFILEGFPRTTEEVSWMGEVGLFTDSAIFLDVEDTDVIARLLPPKLERWRQRRDKKMAKLKKKKEKAQKKREAAIAKRKEELVKEMEAKREEDKAMREAEKGDDEDGEEGEEEEEEEEEEDGVDEMMEEIEAQLADEFEEEEEGEEEEDESEEDAVDRMKNDLNEVYDNDTNRLSTLKEKLEELLVPRIIVDAGRKATIVRYTLTKKLKSIVHTRHSIFERIYPISEKLANRMIHMGYKQMSRFGRWCPVRLMEGDCLQPMQGPGYVTFPVYYRQHIYFLASAQAREQFMHEPAQFLKQPSPKPVVPIRIAVVGPPKSGKTTLAKRFAEEYGVVRLSLGEAIRNILEFQSSTDLSLRMQAHLKKGLTIPDELAVQAIEVSLMDMRCQTRGFVLDGFPVTKTQVDIMTEKGIIPVRVLELNVDSRECATRAMKDRLERTMPLHDSAKIFSVKLASWMREVVPVKEWYHHQHSNLTTLDGLRSKWYMWNEAMEVVRGSIQQIQNYLYCVAGGQAASIADMCITQNEFETRLGEFMQYCPVNLAHGFLVDCSVNPSLKYAAEYRGYYYKMAGERELKEFLSHPDKYVPPIAPNKLPPSDLRPQRLTSTQAQEYMPRQIELKGFCPVTFLDNKCRYESIVPGDPELIVLYRDRMYYFETESNLQKFLRLPEKYWDLKLPHKLPPLKSSMPVTDLPMLGYMEQTVSKAITTALTAVGNFKPKYPFLSTSRSSLLYVAYHLKANNPKSSDYLRKKYARKLKEFEDTCKLITYLGDNMTVKYKQPEERQTDFDWKLETFIQLKNKEPTTTWVA